MPTSLFSAAFTSMRFPSLITTQRVISRFRAFEAWNEIDEIHRISKIDKRHVKKLKRVYNEARKGIIFGKELAIGYEAAGPVKQRKNMKQVYHQAQSAKIWELSTRKVICYGF